MLTFNEAQILAWVTPILWAFLRVLALFGTLPVIGQRAVPMRVRVALAFLIALCAQATLPPVAPIPLDSAVTFLVVLQQIVIGVSIGFWEPVRMVDVNRDGKPEVVVPLNDTQQVAVLRASADGSLQAPQLYAAGGHVQALVATDLNNDGWPDLAMATGNDGNLVTLQNNGAGGFGTLRTYVVGGRLPDLDAGDVNGDGNTDIVSFTHTQALLYLSTGNGTLQAAQRRGDPHARYRRHRVAAGRRDRNGGPGADSQGAAGAGVDGGHLAVMPKAPEGRQPRRSPGGRGHAADRCGVGSVVPKRAAADNTADDRTGPAPRARSGHPLARRRMVGAG